MREHLIIVGAGQAAAQAVLTLRQNGYDGRISVVGDEPHAPYQRPPLSKKYLAGALPRERLTIRPPAFYQDRDVTLEPGVRAMEVDTATRNLRLDDGRTLQYDGLILATGSRVRKIDVPGAELPGLHYLRTIEDVDAIAADFEPGRTLVLVGAGYIGLEVAAVAAQRGLQVTVLEAGDRVMSRVVCPEISDFYHRRHADAGVAIHYGAAVNRFAGTARVEVVETAEGGRYPCDLVVTGIGVVPNMQLAEAAGLPCGDGIIVDDRARTPDPLIAAAGDCTSHPHPFAERRVRLESVQNAIEQAKAAAANFAGPPHRYAEVPWFWSDQYDLKLQIAGLSQHCEQRVLRGDPADGSFAVFYFRDDTVIAVDAVNSPRDFMFGRKLIAARWRGPVEQLADRNVDLSALAAAAAAGGQAGSSASES